MLFRSQIQEVEKVLQVLLNLGILVMMEKFIPLLYKKNGKWSNGDPVTAQDFVWSWKRVLTPSLGSQYPDMLYYVQGAQEYHSHDSSQGVAQPSFDTVGVKVLSNAISQTKHSGIVAACGNASDYKLSTTVMPFIIRGVKLWGINSVTASIKRREFVWNEVSNVIDFDKLEESIKTIGLNELTDIYSKMLKGETSGRYIVDVNK